MTAWTSDMITDEALCPVFLKVIYSDRYRYNVPHGRYQTNPDGVRYERVAHLPSLREPDVTAWVAEHTTPDVFIMVAFARGLEMGQVEPGDVSSYAIAVSRADLAVLRSEARAELREHTPPGGVG